jgi:LuxR family maltose regulon positive regulatory protein
VNAKPRRAALFPLAKFRPTTLPATLLARSALHGQLEAGAAKRLTVVVGSAGAGKSVLLSSWAAARPEGVTSWLSCDEADVNPVRFWTGFIEAPRGVVPGFGADAADLLALDGAMSADITASIANDAAKLPAGSAIVVDDFHAAAAAVSREMTDLVERWPVRTVQLVLASRADPPVRLHRLRMSDELCELRDRDLCLSLAEADALLANFGVHIAAGDLALLHQRSEGWIAALQMAALTLRGAKDPVQSARALDVRSHAIAEYFIAEVLQQQPPEVARFMLDTSVLDELTAAACAAVTGRQDAAELLRGIDGANLFLVALDDEQTSYRYHHLVRQVLRAELHATDQAREIELHLRAAEWFESAGDTQRATKHYLAAQQADRALALLNDRVMADFLRNPALPAPLDLSMVDPALLPPERLLALAADLLLQGDWAHGGKYLDMFDRIRPPVPPDSPLGVRLTVMRAARYAMIGDTDQALRQVLTARRHAVGAKLDDDDEWITALLTIPLRAYTYLDDFDAFDREATAALAMPSLPEPFKLILVRGAQAFAWFAAGRLADAAAAARGAQADARRLGFEQHPWAVDHLRALAGAALERRDFDAAEQLTERALRISERGRPVFEFLVLLGRAEIWAARGQVRDALATIDTARAALPATTSVLFNQADELEALIRLSLGDLSSPAELARRLPAARRGLLLAKVALAAGDHQTALNHLQPLATGDLSPRAALVRQILLAAAAIERGDPIAADILGDALRTARHEGYLHTVVTTAPQVTRYLVENTAHAEPEPFLADVIAAALEVRATQPDTAPPRAGLVEPLTAAELRVLKLLPTASYPQMTATLYISLNTVKTHLRKIYLKLGVSSRSEAIERAVDLGLL